MRHLSTILMLAFACLLPAHAVNLLTNGGFANDGTRIPDWSLPGNEATIDAENFPPEEPGDRQALRIETRRQWAVAEAEFTVAGGLEYLVSYWQRLENATQTHVKLAWFNRDGVLFEETFLSYGQDGTRPWTCHENRLTAPAQAIRCLFRIWAGGTSEQPGISWFDEINISPVDAEAHQQAVEARDAIPVVQRALPPNSMKPRGEAVEVKLAGRVIVVPQNATDQEKTAAELLRRLLNYIYHTNYKIVSDIINPTGGYLSVGATAQAQAVGLTPHPERQGYVIAAQNGNLYFLGGNGPLYAVLAFLQEDLGCRFYTADEPIAVPDGLPTTVDIVPRRYAPPFEIREPLNGEALHRDDFNAFNRVQAVSYFKNLPNAMGGGLSNVNYFIHTYDTLVPADRYFDAHPEYFPLRDGRRFRSRQNEGQLCYTNPEVAAVMATEIEHAIARSPASRIYSVSQNDNTWVECECPDCQKVIQTDGVPGAALLLANRVSEQLAQTLPDIRVTTLAYVETQTPPPNILPSPNTVIFYAPIRQRAGVLGCLPWTDVPQIMQELDGWRKSGAKLYVWDYINQPTMLPHLDIIDRNIDLWLRQGVTGVFLEDWEFHLNSLAPLENWVFMQKLWNPDWSIDALVEDFIAGHYGEAAPELREYVAIQREAWKRFRATRVTGQILTFTAEEYLRMEELLEAAYAKTPVAAVARELVALHKMNLRVCKTAEIERYERVLQRTEELIQKHGLRLCTLGTGHEDTIGEWREQLEDARHGADFPRYCEESLILKKPLIAIHHNAAVQAAGSYIPTVARQVRDTDWGIQWPFDRLVLSADNQSTYVARIRVKPLLNRPHAPAELAFGVNLWRSGYSLDAVQERRVTHAELHGGDWQYIYLFKVYFYSPSVEGYFFNSIGPLDDGEAFLYDLIEFIPLDQFQDTKLAESLPTFTL